MTLENYGVYRGRNEIDISCDRERPVVLVCGFNGNGKTTILDAMMVVLYGKMVLGNQYTKREYEKFINDRMHRSAGSRTQHASVSIAFKFHHNNQDDMYKIKRAWERDGGEITESLVVERNGEPIQDMDDAGWRQFIESLIPYGIARLFFFDGDKIDKISTWNKQGRNPELKRAFDMLLGTELVTRLKADLNLYIIRRSGKTDPTLTKQYEEQEREKSDAKDSIKSMQEEIEQKLQKRNDMTSKAQVLEGEVLNAGGWYARRRETIISKRGIMGEKVRRAREDIINVLEKETPIYILSKQFLDRIAEKLEADIDRSGSESAGRMIDRKIREIKEGMKKNSENIHQPNTSTVLAILKKMSKECKQAAHPHFDLSPNERDEICKMIRDMGKGIKDLHDKSDCYIKNHRDLVEIETEIARIPKDEDIGPKISELNNLNMEIGIIQSEIDDLKRGIDSKESYIRIVKSRMEKLLNSVHHVDKKSEGIRLAGLMQKSLDIYYAGLKERKMVSLEKNLLDAIRTLLRKDMISKVSVDRDTFVITAYDNEGDPMPILSMGERQIIGTALLWALARTSGRPLPFVIDTPLARLDGIHRSKLVESFYPFASHQTVILSTDKEIGQQEYDSLREYISHTYSLLHDDELHVTSIRDGYLTEDEKIVAK